MIVEGDTEKLALPEYSKRENLDFDNVGGTIVEVGGKRNLKAFADLIISFNIPLGIIYDADSTDVEDSEEEKILNQEIESYKAKGATIWSLDKKYEDELRKALGEEAYLKACKKYQKVGKPTRARLIASDNEYLVPDFVKPMIKWLSGKDI